MIVSDTGPPGPAEQKEPLLAPLPLAFALLDKGGHAFLLVFRGGQNLEQAPFETARWISGADATLNAFANINQSSLARDRDDNLVFLAKSAWDVGYQEERNPDLKFSTTRER